jgi:hypothetical protein
VAEGFHPSNSKFFSAFSSSVLEDKLSALGPHAYEKSVIFVPLSFIGLECSFHRFVTNELLKKYVNKPDHLCQVHNWI